MRIFTRHILIELNKVFLISLVALTLLFLIIGVIQKGMQEHLPLVDLLKLIPYILPEYMRYTVPVTMLLATTTLYARMAGFNEVIALKALGVSPLSILWPTFAMAFLLSLATVWLNDLAADWGRSGVQRTISESMVNIAYNMLRTQRSFSTSRYGMDVKRVDGRRLIQLRASMESANEEPSMTVCAQEAELASDPELNLLHVIAREGTVSYQGRGSYHFHESQTFSFPLRDEHDESDANLPSALRLSVIPGKIASVLDLIRNYSQEMVARSAFYLLTPEFEQLGGGEWKRHYEALAWMHSHLSRLETEQYRRWATGFSCLFFVWVGAPLAIRLRNSDLLTSFFLCFLPILVVYYPLMIYGINGAKNGTVPPWSVWIGNILLLLGGLPLLRKILRY